MKRFMTAAFALVLMCTMSAFAKDSSKTEKAPKMKTMKMKGMVSDAKCGAKVDAACAQKCADAGEKLVFVNDAAQRIEMAARSASTSTSALASLISSPPSAHLRAAARRSTTQGA